MRQYKILALAAGLCFAVSSCSGRLEPPAASHPPALDLKSKAEPIGLTEEQLMNDPEGVNEAIYWTDILMWARELFDKSQRVCNWHKERGSETPCDPLPPYKWPNR